MLDAVHVGPYRLNVIHCARILPLLTVAVSLAACKEAPPPKSSPKRHDETATTAPAEREGTALISELAQRYPIELNQLVELDFKSRQQIYDLRRMYVQQHPDLLAESYRPHSGVFAQIESGKPWWGIRGHYFYGRGKLSIAGPAEETRYIANPFLLVGVNESYAYSYRGDEPQQPYYPLAERLVWEPGKPGPHVIVTYDVGRYFSGLNRYRQRPKHRRRLDLIAYNARDFGMTFLYVDHGRSKGVKRPTQSPEPVLIRQYIHRGGSCGYPGGCNNMSPPQPKLEFDLNSLPARLELKLWRKRPRDVASVADYTVTIEMH